MTKQLLLTLDYDQSYIDQIKAIASDYDVIQSVEAADFSKVEIVIGWDNALIDVIESKNHGIKWIQLQSAGADYVPQKQLNEQGIILTTSSGMHKKVIAETIFGFMLSHARKISEAQKYQVKAEWAREILSLSTLEDKTVAIVGTGNIGQQTAKIAKAFDMKTIGVNRSGRSVDYIDQLFVQSELKEAVSEADYVVNILPLTDETKGIYNEDLFNQFKQDSVFINVGRGPSVVTEDLVKALYQGRLSFAALDVFEEEPLPADDPLWHHDQVLITPHTAGHMDDYLGTLYPIIEENLKAYTANKEVAINQVDFKKSY